MRANLATWSDMHGVSVSNARDSARVRWPFIVFETDEALRIGAGLALQYDGASIRQHPPRPHQEQAVLSEGDLAVII
jgi:hypothetical protein